ncbi:hypothetical protein JXB28_00835 [Candidatus Woesearchaeota archaeon]|nr:hypothetical protein [Candidatus Woesearchaeota archaeon]
MILNSRKAIVTKSLLQVILILMVFIVLAGVVVYFSKYFTAKSDREACRTGTLAQSIAMTVPEGQKLIDPKCKTYSITFFDDHVEINGKIAEVYDASKHGTIKKFNGLTDQIVNSVLAEEMRWCWYQFLEGQKKVFTRTTLPQLYVPDLAFICAEARFDPSVQGTEFTGLYDYLQNTYVPKTHMTYYNYLAEEPRICETWDDTLCWEAFFEYMFAETTGWETIGQTVLKKEEAYYVVFAKHGRDSSTVGIIGHRENYATYVLNWNALSKSLDSIMRGSAT